VPTLHGMCNHGQVNVVENMNEFQRGRYQGGVFSLPGEVTEVMLLPIPSKSW
jgi:hypothetical protein